MRKLFALTATSLIACSGQLMGGGEHANADPGAFGDPEDPVSKACAANPLDVPTARLERLDSAQYLNTARALFAAPTVAPQLELSSTPIITSLEVEKFNDAAPVLTATGGHLRFAPCTPTGAHDTACMRSFIQAFGEQAFRRPVTPDEVDWLLGVYQDAKAISASPAISFREALDTVAAVIVQSPQHLYRLEVGVEDPSLPQGLRRLTGHERATRLAYTLTNSTPDEALHAAAKSGELDTEQGLRAQAERLLALPSGHATVRAFASRYTDLDARPTHPSLEANPKDATRFPFVNATLRAAMRNETESFFERVVFEEDGRFETLMTSNLAYVNKGVAALYGVATPLFT